MLYVLPLAEGTKTTIELHMHEHAFWYVVHNTDFTLVSPHILTVSINDHSLLDPLVWSMSSARGSAKSMLLQVEWFYSGIFLVIVTFNIL